MTATTPKIGTTMNLHGECGPSNHLGIVVCGKTKVTPFFVRGVTNCTLWFDTSSFVIVDVVSPPSYDTTLGIPNNSSLIGTNWVSQTVWINLFTIFPFQATNGVQLNLGT